MNERPTLEQVTRNPEFLPRCAAIASRVCEATDGAEVAALLAEAARVFGADSAAFASFVRDDETYESYRFIVACDAAWCLEYENSACFMHDPWWEYARHHAEPILAEQIAARTNREREVVALARRYGFESAVIVPAQSPKGLTRLGALCLGSSRPGFFDGSGLPAVTFAGSPLAIRLHEWQVAQLRQELLENARLSASDMELLRHERQGHGSKQVAAELHLNPLSVDSRWQRLNARLGVSSRVAAASIAAEYGLI